MPSEIYLQFYCIFLIWEHSFYIEIKCTKEPLLKRKFVHFGVENTEQIKIKEIGATLYATKHDLPGHL